MVAQKGRDMLLKLDEYNNGDFQTIAGLRAHSLQFNAQAVESTSQTSTGQWRELLATAGVKSASIRGSGIFRDEAADLMIRRALFDGFLRLFMVIIPDFGTMKGNFLVTDLQYAGRHDGELTFEIGLESAGPIDFMAYPT
jgi:TP901-1 family phage major tail protein